MKIGNRAEEGRSYENLGALFFSLGEYVKAKEYHEKTLAISMEIGDRAGEGRCYGNLAKIFHCVGKYIKAKEYFKKDGLFSLRDSNRIVYLAHLQCRS